MKCEYCNRELPKIVNGKRDICSCVKANEEWAISMEIQHLKKRLRELSKDLSKLKSEEKPK